MILVLGNLPAGEDGAAIYELAEDGILTHLLNLDEQGAHDIHHHHTGEIVVVGSDPANGDGWQFGNLYVCKNGVWSKKRTIPNGLHAWGACEHNGLLYLATSNHAGDNTTWLGQVFWSDDFGSTWLGHAKVNDYRVYDIYSFNGRLYATGSPGYGHHLYLSDDDGATWQIVSDVVPRPRPRLIEYNNRLLVTDWSLARFLMFDSSSIVTELAVPELITNNYNIAAVIGTDLYVLCGANSDHVHRYDGSQWHYHCELGKPCCSLLNFEDTFLIASTMGKDAKILKVLL